MTGCPFVLPFIEVEQNVPPAILDSRPGDGLPVEIETDQYTAFVVAQDPDDLELTFVWDIEAFGIQPQAVPVRTGDLQGSQLTIQADAAYNDKVLTVTVYDAAGATASRSWTILVTAETP